MDQLTGTKHFNEFYDKLNIISKIIKKKTKIGRIEGIKPYQTLLSADDTTEIESDSLIESFNYDTQPEKTTGKPTPLAKQLSIGSVGKVVELTINNNAEGVDDGWFNLMFVNIFMFENDSVEPYKNIKELHSSNLDLSADMMKLFTFNTVTRDKSRDTYSNYVWQSKYDMLALLDQPFLLLSFDMYYYNNTKGKYLFENKFDVKNNGATVDVSFIEVHDLLAIEYFNSRQLPTFLMLLIYYAGYSFNITKENITSKFRNKFITGTSFNITPYVPISNPNSVEIKYNNTVKSDIQPTSVNLEFETLQVYHVASKIASLWDYVNSKLTILINNMLNIKAKIEKDRYKTLFKKKYSLNKLFLFECIDALKKYKEYILIPENLKDIAYPMSTLKTLEILILKLSYIFSLLEPTFIPLETMSFDIIMNGKTLKYVINSELQATNISIDDHISNDKLMEAILSTRAVVIDKTGDNITKATNLLSDDSALELQKSFIQKKLDTYKNAVLEKNVAYKRSEKDEQQSLGDYTKIDNFFTYDKPLSLEMRDNSIQILNLKLEWQKSRLDAATSRHEYEKVKYKMDKTQGILDALTRKIIPAPNELAKLFRELNNDYEGFAAYNSAKIIYEQDIEETRSKLAKAGLVAPRTRATQEHEAKLLGEKAAKVLRQLQTGAPVVDGKDIRELGLVSHEVTVTDDMRKPGNRFGLSFGQTIKVIEKDYELGKILNISAPSVKSRLRFSEALPSPFFNILNDGTKIYILKTIFDNSTNSITWDTTVTPSNEMITTLRDEKLDSDTILSDIFKNGAFNEEHKQKAYKLHYLLYTLQHLITGHGYRFDFFSKKITEPKKQGDRDFVSGGKNTTKKVNRKQRQRKSKTKKVFES